MVKKSYKFMQLALIPFVMMLLIVGCLMNQIEASDNKAIRAYPIVVDETNFPDENFRNYIKNKFGDEIDETEILGATSFTDLSNLGIEDLTGIEYFSKLRQLTMRNSPITKLDLSHNTALEILNCNGNKIEDLNISQNTALYILNIHNNNLIEIDVSSLVNLTNLNVSNNQLKEIDVSNNVKLTQFWIVSNQLSTLDVSKNIALLTLRIDDNNFVGFNLPRSIQTFSNANQKQVKIIMDENDNFDLSTIYADIDGSKISGHGGVILTGTILNSLVLGETVIYQYDCGFSKALKVSLSVHAINSFNTALSINNWTYGDVANVPTIDPRFGTPEFSYSNAITKTYSSDVPIEAGTWYVKANVAGTNYYDAIESAPITFKIAPKNLSNTVIEDITNDSDVKNLVIKDGNKELIKDIDYIINVNKIGEKVTVKIVFQGNYTGTIVKTYRGAPDTVDNTNLTRFIGMAILSILGICTIKRRKIEDIS